jgi:hypothetical protein
MRTANNTGDSAPISEKIALDEYGISQLSANFVIACPAVTLHEAFH